MNVSRRNFLCYAACVPAACFTNNPLRNSAGAHSSKAGSATNRLLLLNFSCSLDESFEGYRVCLRATRAPFEVASCGTAESVPLILLPAAAMTDHNQARWLRNRIEQGSTVLLESGGAFLPQAEFCAQKSVLSSEFGLEVVEPVELWSNPDRLNRPPYVDFTWPVAARIRDFSRMVPINASTREAIALQGSRIVGLKRRLGAGTIVFLGSPVGPHLLAGDREARRWFESLLRHA